MNPNVNAIPAPRLMNDVVPPYADALPTQNHAQTESAEIPVKQEESSHDQPMFPITTPIGVAATPEPAQVQAQIPKNLEAKPRQIETKKHDQAKTNWVIIGAAVSVSIALAYLAILAFKTNN